MSLPTAVEAQLYHRAMVSVSREPRKKKLNISRNAVNSNLESMAVQAVRKAWDGVIKTCSVRLLRLVIQPYLYFNLVLIQLQVSSQQLHGFVLLKQQETLGSEATSTGTWWSEFHPDKPITRSRRSDSISIVFNGGGPNQGHSQQLVVKIPREMVRAGHVSLPERPTSSGIHYTSKSRYEAYKYRLTATAADRTHGARKIWESGDANGLADSVNIIV